MDMRWQKMATGFAMVVQLKIYAGNIHTHQIDFNPIRDNLVVEKIVTGHLQL